MSERRPTLLIVEDDGLTRYALARILGQHGWKVEAVSTVAEGLGRLDAAPACIVVDLMLPDGSGEDVLRRVREAGLGSRVVVVTAVSEKSRPEDLESLR